MADKSRKGDFEVRLVDKDSQIPVKIDGNGRLLVSQEQSAPPASDSIQQVVKGNISGETDSFYTITNGKTLTITLFQAGAQEVVSGGSKVEIYEDVNGNLSVLTLIAVLYVNGNSAQVNVNQEFIGDGTNRIVLRRTTFGGGSREVFGRWSGFEVTT